MHAAIHGGDVDESLELLSKPGFPFLNLVTGHGLFGAVGGQSILHIACRCELPEVCKAILTNSEFTEFNLRDGFGCTALHLAAMQGNMLICQMLLDNAEVLKLDIIMDQWMLLDFRSNKLLIDAWKNDKPRLKMLLKSSLKLKRGEKESFS